MKKRILTLIVTLSLSIIILSSMTALVSAGKGQEKLEFVLYMEGFSDFNPDRAWVSGRTSHLRGLGMNMLGDFYVQIGAGGSVETIPKEELDYECSMDMNYGGPDSTWYVINVREIITIYTDESKTEERGTLELLALGGGNVVGKRISCTGFGTGEFVGVKIKATTVDVFVPPPAGPYLELTRSGIVMGWPT